VTQLLEYRVHFLLGQPDFNEKSIVELIEESFKVFISTGDGSNMN